MTTLPRAVVSWSSGKDSAWALYTVRSQRLCEVVGLLTTVTQTYARVSMHGVREAILRRQAEAAGLPLFTVPIPSPCPNEVYERAMGAMMARLRALQIEQVVFGDLYLEEIRAYREEKMRGTGLAPVFPLWGQPTRALAEAMIDAGVVATLVAVDPRKLDRAFAGRRFDRQLLDDLPAGCDPCGENGEYHTCVTNGPMFRSPIPVRPGPIVDRDGFVFADLELSEPADGASPATPVEPSSGSARSL